VVGNSSSGLIEAPAVGTPTVNIGARQRGRPRAASVINCPGDAAAITAALCQALAPDMQRRAASGESPYGHPGASSRIVDVLVKARIDEALMKRFHDYLQPTASGASSHNASSSPRHGIRDDAAFEDVRPARLR
jgi:UDP-N-acetylglucosamine 2-epimerase (non-hydrolysing)/GDP/UDP-N,N'-diacetylbacillosamine 2-epimerase (hydrolysing)